MSRLAHWLPAIGALALGTFAANTAHAEILRITADNYIYEVYVDGVAITPLGPNALSWTAYDDYNLTLAPGPHTIAIRAGDDGSVIAGMMAVLYADDMSVIAATTSANTRTTMTDPTPAMWFAPSFDDASWSASFTCPTASWGATLDWGLMPSVGGQMVWGPSNCTGSDMGRMHWFRWTGITVPCMAGDCVDGNACTSDVCSGGLCSNPPIAAGTSCAGGVCNGSMTMPMCVACISNAQCGGATPFCNVASNRCVACLGDSDCPDTNECTTDRCLSNVCSHTSVGSGTPCAGGVCNGAAMPMCVACVSDAQCSGATPICDTSESRCVGCLLDGQCNDGNQCTTDQCIARTCSATSLPAGSMCAGGVCDGAALPMCLECLRNSDCSGATPICDVAANLCVECTRNSECGPRGVCTMNRCGDSDTDGDGVPNDTDADSDNDGITDVSESGIAGSDPSRDSDGDRIPNYLDSDVPGFVDANTDGVDDRQDTDLDGVPNFLDLDSDNDGITDIWENGQSSLDADRNGRVDAFADADRDGLASEFDMNDMDASVITSGFPVLDTDMDGTADLGDLDADGDGLFDIVEARGEDGNADGRVDSFTDADGNGLAALVDPAEMGTPLLVPDTDGDARFNFQDVDDDGDSILTRFEAPDANGDRVPTDARDSDMDGFADYLDADDDGDRVPTRLEAPDANADGDPSDARNTDGDLVGGDVLPDYLDVDDDADGLNTRDESPDPNNDSLIDDALNTDGDAVANWLDPDDDDDGIPTSTEVRDGMTHGNDVDGDSQPNWLDLDSDGDSLTDMIECPAGVDCPGTGGRPDYVTPMMGVDAGPVPDAGRRDSGVAAADAGVAFDSDARADAGPTAGGLAGGACGCTAVGGSASRSGWISLLLGLGLVLATRRRRSR